MLAGCWNYIQHNKQDSMPAFRRNSVCLTCWHCIHSKGLVKRATPSETHWYVVHVQHSLFSVQATGDPDQQQAGDSHPVGRAIRLLLI